MTTQNLGACQKVGLPKTAWTENHLDKPFSLISNLAAFRESQYKKKTLLIWFISKECSMKSSSIENNYAPIKTQTTFWLV